MANSDIDFIQQRLLIKKDCLKRMQESYTINLKDIQMQSYEDNAINLLLNMKQLKCEIAELEFLISILSIN